MVILSLVLPKWVAVRITLSSATLQAIYNGRPVLPKDATSRPQVIVKVGYFILPFDNYGDKLNDIEWDFIQATR